MKMMKDHDLIRRWVEERDGYPATAVKGAGKADAGILTIGFPHGSKNHRRITWELFFEKFEEKQLAMAGSDEADGCRAMFMKRSRMDEDEKVLKTDLKKLSLKELAAGLRKSRIRE